MANYNSGYKYNSGHLYNTRISYVTVGGSISPAGSIIRKASRQLISNIAISSIISRKKFGTVGNAQTAISSTINKKSTKTVANGTMSISGSILRQVTKMLASTVDIASAINKISQYARLIGNGSIGITALRNNAITKSINGAVSIQASFSRASTFFRHVGFQFFYNMGLRYNTPIERNGNVNISGDMSKTIFRNLSGAVDILGAISKIKNILISASVEITSGIVKSIGKFISDTVRSYGIFTRVATCYRQIGGSMAIEGIFSRTASFYRSMAGSVSMLGGMAKSVMKYIFGTVIVDRNPMEFVGNGIVGISSTLTRLKYYFFVTLDNILMPLGVQIARDSPIDIVPSTRDYTDEIPGRHGEVDFGTELGARAIEFHVATDEMGPEERENLKRQYAKHIKSDIPKSLVFENDLEKTYEVKYAGKIDPTQYPLFMDFTIPFKMTKPFIEGSYEKVHAGSGTISNDGTFETPLVIEIKGPAKDPVIIIGDDTLSYTGTIANGQTLVIDTEKQTAKIGSVNVIDGYNSVFPMLKPGSVDVMADNNVTIKWHDRWL